MASIVFADSTLRYDGRDLERRPLGGTETSVIRCARELARRGHQVTCFTNCDGPVEDHGVSGGRCRARRRRRAISTSPATSSICCRLCRARNAARSGCCGRPTSCGTTRNSGRCGSTGRSRSWSASIRRTPGRGCCRGAIRCSCCRSACPRMSGGIRLWHPRRHRTRSSRRIRAATCIGWWRSGRRRSCRVFPAPCSTSMACISSRPARTPGAPGKAAFCPRGCRRT